MMNIRLMAGNTDRRIGCLILVSLVWLCCDTDRFTAKAGDLETIGGDSVAGSFAAADASIVAWQHPGFVQPFHFDIASVNRISQSAADKKQIADGAFVVELDHGERLYGDIVDVDEERIQVRTSDLGDISVKRSTVRSIAAWNNGDSVLYRGPGEIKSWRATRNWSNLDGSVETSDLGASITGDVRLPEMADIQLEISWRGTPNFAVALGVDPPNGTRSAKEAFRIEVRNDEVVALWERDTVADIAQLGDVESMAGQLRIMVRLDQPNRQAEIYSEDGSMLGKLKLPKRSDPAYPGISVSNVRGQVRVDSIQVMKSQPRSVSIDEANQPKSDATNVIYLADDSSVSGNWIGVESDEWIFQIDEDEPQRINSSKVTRLVFVQRQMPPVPNANASAEIFRLSTFAGQRLAGRYLGVSDGRLQFHPGASVDPVSLLLSDLRTFHRINAGAKSAVSSGLAERRLIAEGTSLRGRFVPTSTDASTDASSSVMRFEPMGASAADMQDHFSGRYVFRSPAQAAELERPLPRPAPPPAGVWGLFTRAFGNNPTTQAKVPLSISLRTGDEIPASISKIDETGVHFESDMSAVTHLSVEAIESVRLQAGQSQPTLEEIERERLLTVPRMRKRNPPTHLVIGINGDVLRCNFKGLDERTVTIETRLETIAIDRKYVAQIIWLGKVGQEEDSGLTKPEERVDGLFVQAKLFNGYQLGIVPEQVTETELIGSNPSLGKTRIRFVRVDEFLFGDAAWKEKTPQSNSKWMLSDAPEPEIIEGGDGNSGTASPLVGKPAPEIKLQLLDDTTFSLSEQKGKVVVLDFWATWCGPCLQVMPTIGATVSKFDADQVILVAVNLQESPALINLILNRLKIEPIVALDIDGVAAQRYQATVIPQTVVIDRKGVIQKLFVGGGSEIAGNLERAITDCLTAVDGS